MTEHQFESRLQPGARGGWVEPPPGHCHRGHPPSDYQHHWLPCNCGGHRAVRCNQDGHTHEDDRYYDFHPEVEETCRMDVRPTAPG